MCTPKEIPHATSKLVTVTSSTYNSTAREFLFFSAHLKSVTSCRIKIARKKIGQCAMLSRGRQFPFREIHTVQGLIQTPQIRSRYDNVCAIHPRGVFATANVFDMRPKSGALACLSVYVPTCMPPPPSDSECVRSHMFWIFPCRKQLAYGLVLLPQSPLASRCQMHERSFVQFP